jgi:hypothetical protein
MAKSDFEIYFVANSDSSNVHLTHGKMYIKTGGMNLILSTFLPNSKQCFVIYFKVKTASCNVHLTL